MPQRVRHSIVRAGLLLGTLAVLGAGCQRAAPGPGPKLTVWGVFDDSETMRPLIDAFTKQTQRGRVSVEYRKISPADQYEEILSTALREGRGPDIFVIHNSWLPRWQGSLLPAPKDTVSVRAVQSEFVDVVANDFVVDGRVYGLPLFVDSLALYYNKSVFNSSGIARPPATWNEVFDVVRRTTRFNTEDRAQIDQQGIALGAGRNVNRAPDILSALLIQNGAQILGDNKAVEFGKDERAKRALQFITDFANPALNIYTWQLTSHYSLDAFAEGTAAMMLNYSYHRSTIRAKNPRLNFAVAPFPQLDETPEDQRTTYASYWAFVASRQTPNPGAAWEFIKFLTSQVPAREYGKKSGYPPSRRDLIEERQNDSSIGVFVEQALYAKTWRQPDNRVVDRVFVEAMDDVVAGVDTVEGALQRAAEQIQVAAKSLAPSRNQ